MRYVFVLLLVFFCNAVSQAPSWRQQPPPVTAGAGAGVAVAPASSSSRVVYKTKLVSKVDTLRVLDTVFISKVDTIRDTVNLMPVQYKYIVRYALTALNVEMSNPEWLDYASYNEIIARDSATLRIGTEEIRTLGSVIDQFGNKIPQTDIVTTGFTIQIKGDNAVIEYRGKNSLAVFSGSFDNSGFLLATGEITEANFLASFFPFNLFFRAGKKKIIIEILREAYL